MPMNTFTSNGDGSAASTVGITDNSDGSATSIYVASNGDGSGHEYILDTAELSGVGDLTWIASPGFADAVDLLSEGVLYADVVAGFADAVDLPSGEGTLTAVGRPTRDITVNVLAVTGRQFGITVGGRTLTVKASF